MAGCKDKYKEDPTVEPASLQSSFASADAATKGAVDAIISNINAMHFEESLTELQKVYGQAGVTPEQQKTILGVKSFVMKKIAEAARNVVPK